MSSFAQACGLPLDDWHRNGWRGAGMRIAHLDSGIDGDLELFAGRVGGFFATDRDGQVLAPAQIEDTTGHGTFTACILSRIAPDATLLIAQVIEGGATVWRLLKGLDWALQSGAHIALMPVGIKAGGAVLDIAFQYLRRAGVLPIAAVGNTGAGRVMLPGALPNVLSIGACNRKGIPVTFSGSSPANNRPIRPDLLACGVDIPGLCPGGTAEHRLGTSLSAAVAAGAIAVLSAGHSATPIAVADKLCLGARPLPSERKHRARYGVLDLMCLSDVKLPVEGHVPASLCPELATRLRYADVSTKLDIAVATQNEMEVPAHLIIDRLPRLSMMRLRLTPLEFATLHSKNPDLCAASVNPLSN